MDFLNEKRPDEIQQRNLRNVAPRDFPAGVDDIEEDLNCGLVDDVGERVGAPAQRKKRSSLPQIGLHLMISPRHRGGLKTFKGSRGKEGVGRLAYLWGRALIKDEHRGGRITDPPSLRSFGIKPGHPAFCTQLTLWLGSKYGNISTK